MWCEPAGKHSAGRAEMMRIAKARERRQGEMQRKLGESRARGLPRDKQLLSITHRIPAAQVTLISRHACPNRNRRRLAQYRSCEPAGGSSSMWRASFIESTVGWGVVMTVDC